MSITAILLPVFVQVALTFALLLWTARSRIATLRSGTVKVRDVALGERNWPTPVLQVANAYHNQLELPVLFYVLVILSIITRKADIVLVTMSWVFVVTRLVHASIHTTSNKIAWRFQAFALGVVILMLMWIIFAVRIVFAEAGL